MASGSTGRSGNPGAKGFDFGSDDILCSYEDYGHQDGSHGSGHSEPITGSNSTKEFHKSNMARTSAFPSASYSPPEDSSLNQDLALTVELTMKKYTDNIIRFLEGISSRMSQLELYCYKLDKTIGEMRSELVRDHGEADSKLQSLEKHVQEVHRSVQILRDKQELADTQKELAKLHVQKESSSSNSSQQNQDRPTMVVSENKSSDTSPDNQLALALPNQVHPQAPVPNRSVEQLQLQPHIAPALQMPIQSTGQLQGSYYLSQAQPSNVQSPAQPSQSQYLSADSQFRASQMQDLTRVPPQTQLNQSSQVQLLSPYQPQWNQQLPQQVQQQQSSQQVLQAQQQLPQPAQQAQQQLPQQGQQSAMQSQMRPSSSHVYSPYVANQANPSPEGVPNSMPAQIQFSGMAQSAGTRLEAVPYGYGAAGRPVQPQPSTQQHLKPSYASGGDAYVSNGPHPTFTPGNAYVIYDEGGRGSHHPTQPPHLSLSGYPPSSLPNPNIQPRPASNVFRPPLSRNNPYSELIEKMLSMGYRGDHVVGAIQRLEESGQTVDFNAVLDRLNGHISSGGAQRGWTG